MGLSEDIETGVTQLRSTRQNIVIHGLFIMSKSWSNGTFDCFSDMGTCCMATWCGCCLVYSDAEELGESGLLYFLLGCFITPCIPVMMLRSKASSSTTLMVPRAMTPSWLVAVTAVLLFRPPTKSNK